MNFKRFALLFVVLFACVSCTLSAAEIKKFNAYYTISVEDIEKSLPAEPIAIGLDVDDTALFSSPGFYYAFNNTDGPNGENI